ncbi:MAG: DmsE family decaheme c-type cytochrome [Thermoanaerobaculia bacterium]
MNQRFIRRTGKALALAALAVISFATIGEAGARAGKEVDWKALNPAYEGAEFVRDPQLCAGCHDESTTKYSHTTHARVLGENGRTALDRLDCESCHGPMSKHVENPTTEFSLDNIRPAGRSQICLQCHSAGKDQMHWQNGQHAAAGISCDSCHVVMERRSQDDLLSSASQESTCYSCHSDVRASMQKSSHHPVREGKMSCSSCHNPHGSTGPAMMRRSTITETCHSCHQDKRGPFLWEHPPAREDCTSCHAPHGSNNRSMLEAKAHMVCLQCHSYGGHINLPRYNRTSTPTQQGCINCHVTPHGSNHPSGSKLTR